MNEEHYTKLKTSAQRYTAYRERAPKEVVDKLFEWGATEEIIDQILSELKSEDFINEDRFARAFCHDKFLTYKWGKHRILSELYKYELSESTKTQGLDYINQDEYEKTLAELAKQKWQRTPDADLFKRRNKTANFLIQKGYESDLIWDVVNKLE